MRSAIRKHLGDFIALVALFTVGVATAGYILSQQNFRFPLIEDKPMQLKAVFKDAQAVVSGQGQTVRVAGVRVGDIGKVELEDGQAVVTMNIDPGSEAIVHQGATALLRTKTGLKDMFIELDPGPKDAPRMKEGGEIPVSNTLPDVDQDEILASLDADTRDYLKLLIDGGGKGLEGRAGDLREVFKSLEPLHRDLARVQTAIADRRKNLARLVHNYGSLISELGDKDQELTRLVVASNSVFDAFASQDANISSAVSKLPSSLDQTSTTLAKVEDFARVLGPSLESLRPAFRKLDDANRQVLPFVREAEPILRKQVRPFVREARPYLRDLRPAARDLSAANPDLTRSFYGLNRFFNMAAFNPGGSEKLTGDFNRDRRRDEGYLFWVGWIGHLTNNLFNTSDASGPFRRALFGVTCNTALELLNRDPELAPIFGITGDALSTTYCPGGAS